MVDCFLSRQEEGKEDRLDEMNKGTVTEIYWQVSAGSCIDGIDMQYDKTLLKLTCVHVGTNEYAYYLQFHSMKLGSNSYLKKAALKEPEIGYISFVDNIVVLSLYK